VNLTTTDVQLPLGGSIKTTGDAHGQLDLQKVRLEPSGLFGELASLTGTAGQGLIPVKFGKLDFVVQDGRLRYDDFKLGLPNEVDLEFYGSVGFDSTVDLVVSIPVRGPLLEQLGVRGPALEAVKQMTSLRVDIPIAGTREQPKLDLSRVDKEKLLKQLILPAAPGKAAEELLKGVVPGTKDSKGGKPKK
jgi:hypothetical protein